METMAPAHGFAMQHPILVWYIALEILGLLAFPFTFVFLPNLLDRGFIVAKTMGLLILGYVAWVAVSLGLATYD